MARRPRVTVVIATLAAAAFVFTGAITPAHAAPRDLEQVREQVLDLQAKAETATERYNEAQGRLNGIEDDLAALRDKVRREKAELREISGAVDNLARATYTGGGVDSSLQVLLADDPNEFLAQSSALDQVANAQSAALRRTQTARLRLAQSEAAVQQKQQAAKGVRDEMRELKQEADARLAEAQKVLDSLEAKELARLNAIAAAERRAAFEAAAAARREVADARPDNDGPSAGGGGYAGGGRAARAVQYALAQVGDRYVTAAAGPSSFDCSGLMLAAWRQAGVSLPHYSYAQYQRARKIPLSQAQPGDLVFYFGGGVHHVGMYIGNGKMVHAANPREGVTVTSVLGPWYNRYFTGVGRVAG